MLFFFIILHNNYNIWILIINKIVIHYTALIFLNVTKRNICTHIFLRRLDDKYSYRVSNLIVLLMCNHLVQCVSFLYIYRTPKPKRSWKGSTILYIHTVFFKAKHYFKNYKIKFHKIRKTWLKIDKIDWKSHFQILKFFHVKHVKDITK